MAASSGYEQQARLFLALSHPCGCASWTSWQAGSLRLPSDGDPGQAAALRLPATGRTARGRAGDRPAGWDVDLLRLADDQLGDLLDSAKGLVQSLDGQSAAFPPIPVSPWTIVLVRAASRGKS